MLQGIICGLIVAVIIYLVTQLFQRIVIPLIQGPSPSIRGVYHYCYDNLKITAESPDQKLDINTQYGWKISGILTVNKWADGSQAKLSTKFIGDIVGDKVFLTSRSYRTHLFGASLFQILDGGKKLKGKTLTLDPDNGKINAFDREWVKQLNN